jgi:hypothetical protein
MTEVDFALKDKLRQASFDPGSIVGGKLGPSWPADHPAHREQEETVWEWVARATYAVVRPEPNSHDEPPRVEVVHGDRADLVGTAGELLSLLDYERLLVLQERIEDAVNEMVFLPAPGPGDGIRRPRKTP